MSESADLFLLKKLRDIAETATDPAEAFKGMRMLLRAKFKPGSFLCRECQYYVWNPLACAGLCPYCHTEFGPDFDAYLKEKHCNGA